MYFLYELFRYYKKFQDAKHMHEWYPNVIFMMHGILL